MRLVVAPESVVARVVRIARLDDLPTYPTLTAALHTQPERGTHPA